MKIQEKIAPLQIVKKRSKKEDFLETFSLNCEVNGKFLMLECCIINPGNQLRPTTAPFC